MAMFIDDSSVPATKTELDLFTVPPTQVAVERGFWEEIRPVNTVTNNGPYEFFVDGNQYYLDMASNYVYLKLKITMEAGDDLDHAPGADGQPQPNRVAPINLIGKTFFKQVKLMINGKLAYDSGTDYPFLSYILTDLNYDRNAKDTHLKAAGFEQECTDAINDVNLLHTHQNPGWEARRQLFKHSRLSEFMAPLHIPFAHQEKYLLSNMDVRIELHRVSDAFALLAVGNQQYKVAVQDIKLFIRKVELSRDLSLAMEQALMRMTAKYPVRRLELKTIHIGQGRRTTPTNTLWNGQLPRRVVMCTIDSDGYFGTYHRNPFVFTHNNVIKAAVFVNGQCVPHSGPLETQFRAANDANNEPSLVMRAFTQLYNSMGIGVGDKSNGITMHRFLNDACYFVFDLSADNTSDSANWELLRAGTISIFLEFSANIPANGLRVLVLGEFDNLISIDRNRNIYYDYTV
jgi:hypothetical protein